MNTRKRLAWTGLVGLTLAATLGAAVPQKDDNASKNQDARPRLTLKAQPAISMAPSRVILTAELAGGASDFEDYYCPAVEWEWATERLPGLPTTASRTNQEKAKSSAASSSSTCSGPATTV